VRPRHRSDTLDDILDAPDREDWLAWVRTRRMAIYERGWLMLHAGVVPQWDLATTLELAADLEQSLRQRPPREFLAALFGNEPARWSDSLDGDERLRFTLNTLTRIRFVADDGTLEFQTKDGADAAPPGFRPWFDVPGRRTAGVPVAFGHWSSLGLVDRKDLLGLDTGCVWGGRLTAVRIDGGEREIFHVECDAAAGAVKRSRAGAAR
jgi:bis(5'-nucleosyl)-tetraphosphatase (symmetrical)